MFQSDGRSYRLVGDVLSVAVENEAILLSVGAGEYYGIRGAMRHLLEELRDGLRFEEMVARLCSRYDVAPGEAARDLEQMLPRLIAARIIEPVPES